MEEVLTEKLLDELLSKPNVDSFIDENSFDRVNLADNLQQFLQEKNLSRKDVIHKTNINETHAYQIFSGDRGASRNKVLQLAVALSLNLKETNKLLHSAGVSALYCKDKQDAIIIFGIEHGFNLQKIDEDLFRFGEPTLSNE